MYYTRIQRRMILVVNLYFPKTVVRIQWTIHIIIVHIIIFMSDHFQCIRILDCYDHLLSTREDQVFTGVCHSVRGRGVPWSGYPLPRDRTRTGRIFYSTSSRQTNKYNIWVNISQIYWSVNISQVQIHKNCF